MKNFFKTLTMRSIAIIAFVAVIGFTMMACAVEDGGLWEGTYTAIPRIQAKQGGVPVDAYIDRIVVTGNYVVFYMTNVPEGWSSRPYNSISWYNNYSTNVLTDLNNPANTWNPVACADLPGGGMTLSFENVTVRRFSLKTTQDSPPVIFEGIILR